ncbi:MAG TPA: hypothetical protein VFX30_02300 [bacterium]|nr:hypothetical protein [bacterium]
MLRLLSAWIGLSGVPVLLALLPFAPARVTAHAPVHAAVWEIRDRQNAEAEALKDRIESLQARVDSANARLTAAIAALESGDR